jgi:hypothetical protein
MMIGGPPFSRPKFVHTAKPFMVAPYIVADTAPTSRLLMIHEAWGVKLAMDRAEACSRYQKCPTSLEHLQGSYNRHQIRPRGEPARRGAVVRVIDLKTSS